MPINIDKALGEFPQHLSVYGRRSSLLASNIANSDTPGYKARDIDFRTELDRAHGELVALKTTNKRHLGGSPSPVSESQLLYRVPHQASLDGNTVDSQVEQAEFTQNAIRYQSTLTFLSGRINGLKLAIKGE
jgi:flagellar basal-body rod protein FlgB